MAGCTCSTPIIVAGSPEEGTTWNDIEISIRCYTAAMPLRYCSAHQKLDDIHTSIGPLSAEEGSFLSVSGPLSPRKDSWVSPSPLEYQKTGNVGRHALHTAVLCSTRPSSPHGNITKLSTLRVGHNTEQATLGLCYCTLIIMSACPLCLLLLSSDRLPAKIRAESASPSLL